MHTLEIKMTISGNDIQSLEEFYLFDRSIQTHDVYHDFGIYCKERVAANTMRDMKKESFDIENQVYTLNLYFDEESQAQSWLDNAVDNNWWPTQDNASYSSTETIKSVTPLQTAGAVAISSDWWDNPALDVNQ